MIKTYRHSLSVDFCAKLISKFEGDKRVDADPQPDYSLRRFLSLSQCADWMPMIGGLVETTNRLAEDYFSMPGRDDELVVPDWIDDGYVMAKYAEGDSLALHADGQSTNAPHNGLRIATVLYFLNTCQGGELIFPVQGVKIAPEAGMAVFFPPDHWYPHEVLPAITPRFIVQTWLTDPALEVVPRELVDDAYDD